MQPLFAYQATRQMVALHVDADDWVLVRPAAEPPDQTLILCRFRGEVVFGIYRHIQQAPALQPLDAAQPVLINRHDDFRIFGAVVGTRKGPAFPELRTLDVT